MDCAARRVGLRGWRGGTGFSGDAWLLDGGVGGGGPLGTVWEEGRQNGVDQERAAPPGTATSAVTTVLCMPEAASARFSQLRDPNEMRFEPLCAKFKILQLC